jgi:hypothetical protein
MLFLIPPILNIFDKPSPLVVRRFFFIKVNFKSFQKPQLRLSFCLKLSSPFQADLMAWVYLTHLLFSKNKSSKLCTNY